MKKYFCYELKKSWRLLLILVAVCAIPYYLYIANGDLFFEVEGNPNVAIFYGRNGIPVIFTMLGALCTIVPMITLSFKTDKRSVDAYYSLPIKREKIFLIKTLVGLLMVFAAYTVAFWLGFLNIVTREHYFRLSGYVVAYFASLPIAVAIYGYVSFLFSQANRTSDGVLFVLGHILCLFFVVGRLTSWISIAYDDGYESKWWQQLREGLIVYAPLNNLGMVVQNLLTGEDGLAKLSFATILMPIVYGGLGWFFFFWFIKRQKAEDAEQPSDSIFGYKVLIPAYTAMIASLNSVFFVGLAAVSAIVGFVVWKRKTTIPKSCWISLAISLAVGMLIGV